MKIYQKYKLTALVLGVLAILVFVFLFFTINTPPSYHDSSGLLSSLGLFYIELPLVLLSLLLFFSGCFSYLKGIEAESMGNPNNNYHLLGFFKIFFLIIAVIIAVPIVLFIILYIWMYLN